jgi:hypothetical protein
MGLFDEGRAWSAPYEQEATALRALRRRRRRTRARLVSANRLSFARRHVSKPSGAASLSLSPHSRHEL